MSSLGDIIHALPSLYALRELFPDACITWAIHESFAKILPGKPWIDNVYVIDRKRIKKINTAQYPVHTVSRPQAIRTGTAPPGPGMPTDTLEAAGRSRCADPIGRARHPPNAGKRRANPSRNRPGKGRFRPFRQDMQTRKATPRRKRHIQGDNETHIETIRHTDPARNAGRIAPTISGSRLTVPERISPARRPEASPPKRSGKEPSGPPSPENLRTTGRMSSRLFLRAAGADSGNDFPARSLLVTGS